MKTMKRAALLGLGALGSIYAERLSKGLAAGCFHAVMDGPHAERHARDGLFVNGSGLDFPVLPPDGGDGSADLVIVAVKYRDLAAALDSMSSHVGAGTHILLPLNGLSSEEMAAERYGRERVLYSVASGVDSRREGNRVTTASAGTLLFGEARNAPDAPSERVSAVRELFGRVGIPCEVPPDMLRVLWWKLMVNTGINQTSAVLDAPYGAFQKDGDAREIMLAAQREVVDVARAAGIDLDESDIRLWTDQLAGLSPEGCSSSVQDIRMGRRTEVDYLGKVVAGLGLAHGVPTPVNDLLVRFLHAIESLRSLR